MFDLAAVRGTPVVVNFWASWCVPCRNEFPLLKAAAATHGEDVLIVGILFEDQAEPARAFDARMGATWPTVLDPGGELKKAYRVVGPPQTWFIDREGIVRDMQIGELAQTDLDRQLELILR